MKVKSRYEWTRGLNPLDQDMLNQPVFMAWK
ncbi:hypothetical protein OpiT1DRAFT_03392 [Opitutaceae bacterium TAV1]|nr:hypothetical protein OpiT1DRAFT_03392 [Opitutaceae bacterium TAV1]